MDRKPFVGQLDRKIQVVELTKSQTSTGSEITTDTVVCEPYAFMEDISGGEVEEGKVIHMVNRTYIIRFNASVKEKSNQLIVIDENQRYQVVHAVEIGRKSFLKLIVKIYE